MGGKGFVPDTRSFVHFGLEREIGESRCVYCCDVIFAIRWKRKKEEWKKVNSCVSRQKEHRKKIL